MLDFEEWKTKRYRPTIPNDEDLSQDPADCRRALKEDQERQYDVYVTQFEPKESEPTTEEKRIVDTLRNTVSRNNDELRNTKSRAEYMRAYRQKSIRCPKCGHQFHSLKRV